MKKDKDKEKDPSIQVDQIMEERNLKDLIITRELIHSYNS